MPDQNDKFAAEQFYDKLHEQEVTPQEEPEEPQFCLSAQWMKIVSEFLKAEKNEDFPEDPIKMALKIASNADNAINRSVEYSYSLNVENNANKYSSLSKECLKTELYKTAATCLRMLKELNKTDRL